MAAPSAADIAYVRLRAIGDADDITTLPDATITTIWNAAGGGDALLTAAVCCTTLANAAALNFRWSADGTTVDKTMTAGALRQNAAELRREYEMSRTGGGTITVTRSEDVDDADTEYVA